jgi:hypothetical protein
MVWIGAFNGLDDPVIRRPPYHPQAITDRRR